MKKKHYLLFLLALLFLLTDVVWAQTSATVSGVVIDENGETLPGVSVVEVGTTNGVLTDLNGHYTLKTTSAKPGMQDDTLYNMTDNTEYQANLFAADLLIEDEEIEDMVQNEDLDYFGLCSSLNATPELMSFKLYSLTKRGQAYHMPMEIQSNFLAK